jgi:hypothetical protein
VESSTNSLAKTNSSQPIYLYISFFFFQHERATSSTSQPADCVELKKNRYAPL